MRRYLKFIAGFFLIPITRWYLRKERHFHYQNIHIRIFTTVFHPGFFGSTKFILQHLKNQDLENRTFLEVGSGSGLISVFAAANGANVTALDLNPVAIQNTKSNAELNGVTVKVVQSDLFESIEPQPFDWIAINPPYYPKAPETHEELAWYCGEDFEYFRKLFNQIGDYMNAKSSVIMVLSQACDIESIKKIAMQSGFTLELTRHRRAFFEEKTFLFSIRKT
jgi:release factor glutamine methyltransferase